MCGWQVKLCNKEKPIKGKEKKAGKQARDVIESELDLKMQEHTQQIQAQIESAARAQEARGQQARGRSLQLEDAPEGMPDSQRQLSTDNLELR